MKHHNVSLLLQLLNKINSNKSQSTLISNIFLYFLRKHLCQVCVAHIKLSQDLKHFFKFDIKIQIVRT